MKKNVKGKLVKAKKLPEKKLAEIVVRYKEIQVEENKLKAEKEELKALLKTDMKLKQLSKLDIEDIHVTYSEFVKEYFNSQAFKEAHPKMYKEFIYFNPQELITVK